MADLADRVAELGRRSVARSADRREAILQAEAERAAAMDARRAQLREQMPKVSRVVDEFRAVFGDGVRVIAAAEGGRVVVNRAACERVGVDWRRYG